MIKINNKNTRKTSMTSLNEYMLDGKYVRRESKYLNSKDTWCKQYILNKGNSINKLTALDLRYYYKKSEIN